MDIQVQTSMTVRLELSEDEARAILADPKSFQHDLRAAMSENHAGGGRGKSPFVKSGNGRNGNGVEATCKICGATMSKRGLNVHIARMHPHVDAVE
jgi:hypothetical protein